MFFVLRQKFSVIMGTVPVITIVHRSSRDAEDSVPYDLVSAFGRKGS